jgi:hypothetical protein
LLSLVKRTPGALKDGNGLFLRRVGGPKGTFLCGRNFGFPDHLRDTSIQPMLPPRLR